MKIRNALMRDRVALVCFSFILLLLIGCVLAPWLTAYDPLYIDTARKLASPDASHWLGTDHLGRDIFSRLLYGARITLGFSILTMLITATVGSLLGIMAGYMRGRVDNILMRLCDIMVSFPSEVLILAMVGMLGPTLENVVLACIVAKFPWYTRMVRTITRKYTDMNYILYARVAGFSTSYIIRRHLVPCAAGEIVVLATLDSGSIILLISALSFLGLGVQPPTPEWGTMLSEAKNIMTLYPWQMLPPGLAILTLVAAFNFLGDSLRDAFDPLHQSGGSR